MLYLFLQIIKNEALKNISFTINNSSKTINNNFSIDIG